MPKLNQPERAAFFENSLSNLQSVVYKKEKNKFNPKEEPLPTVKIGAEVTLDEILKDGLPHSPFRVYANSDVELAVEKANYSLDGECGSLEEYWEAFLQMGPDELPNPQWNPHRDLGFRAGFREVIYGWWSANKGARRFFFEGENPKESSNKYVLISSGVIAHGERAQVKKLAKEEAAKNKIKLREEIKKDWWGNLIERKRQEFLAERKERDAQAQQVIDRIRLR